MVTFGSKNATLLWVTLAGAQALTTVTYTGLPEPTLNLTTGGLTQTGTAASYAMLLQRYRREEIDGVRVLDGDRMAKYPVDDFTGVPTVRDTITIAGVVWSVIGVEQKANEGLWVWQLRRTGTP